MSLPRINTVNVKAADSLHCMQKSKWWVAYLRRILKIAGFCYMRASTIGTDAPGVCVISWTCQYDNLKNIISTCHSHGNFGSACVWNGYFVRLECDGFRDLLKKHFLLTKPSINFVTIWFNTISYDVTSNKRFLLSGRCSFSWVMAGTCIVKRRII